MNELPSPSEEDGASVKPKTKRIRLEDLAPEDMVRRQRRRERNKIAATKCRNKKKARTVNLMKVRASDKIAQILWIKKCKGPQMLSLEIRG